MSMLKGLKNTAVNNHWMQTATIYGLTGAAITWFWWRRELPYLLGAFTGSIVGATVLDDPVGLQPHLAKMFSPEEKAKNKK